MRHLEFLGIPGSGKTTLCEELLEASPHLTGLNDAVLASVRAGGEDRLARAVARITRRSWSSLWRSTYARSADRTSALNRFLAANPAALEAALAAQRSRRERDRGQEQAMGWLLNLMSGYQLATEHLGSDAWLVIDEGFCQRAVALFGYGFSAEDEDLLDRYLRSVPGPEAVVVVETPVETAAARLDQRGWSERLDGSRPDDRRVFLSDTVRLVEIVTDHLRRAGSELIWVDGTTPTPESMLRITATLEK